jgi:hypothetical protein
MMIWGRRTAMGSDERAEIVFPVSAGGRRSTSAAGQAVVAGALAQVDPDGAEAARRETDWRSRYPAHLRTLVETGLASRKAAVTLARDGLAALYEQMRLVRPDGTETGLDALVSGGARGSLSTVTVTGGGTPERELAVPYRGELLRGDTLLARLQAWVTEGIIEPSCAAAVRAVAAHPEWLALPGRTMVVLGAGAEVGPLPVLLGWGVRVAAVDLPRPGIWEQVLQTARRGGGTLLAPANAEQPSANQPGADLTGDMAAVADWLAALDGPLVLGNYVYADGADNVRVCAAVDALTVRLRAARPDTALAFLATPTDVFAVPADAVAHSARAYADRSVTDRMAGGLLHALSGGRLLHRAYPPDTDPGICDSLITQQGPNYALAKRAQRWRATVAREDGAVVSLNVAPPTRTRSVTKNRILAAAYEGAHRFGVEVFEPETTRALMAVLLVHDLNAGALNAGSGGEDALPWQDEARSAAHGGLWRIAYTPRSALGLGVLMGYPAAVSRAGRRRPRHG